jgi:threonylcarbamoyladenosine tRNA methylthiotransferase MtaB
MSRRREFVPAAHFGGAIEDRARPNLKIQDGCDSRCSFCIIPSVRGLSRSLPVQTVLDEIRSLAEAGYREVVISGVNLGQYGRDLPGKPPFARLIQAILDETRVERLRLSSVEPMDFTDALLDLMASTPRIARHVHAPLQSGSDSVLRRMHRKYRVTQYRERIQAAYERMPNAAFGADVIVGFPGESERDFEATRRLIEELPFTYLHVFPFSRRPETPADGMKDQVNGATARERGRVLRELVAEKHRGFCRRHIGRTLRVLTLGASGSSGTVALSDNYLKVFLPGPPVAGNQWREAQIEALTETGLAGRDVTSGHLASHAMSL